MRKTKIDCCSNALQSTLAAAFDPEDHTNCANLIGQFPIVWNGVKGAGAMWTSEQNTSINNPPKPDPSGDLTIELRCPGSEPGSMCTIDWAIGGKCSDSGSVQSPCACYGCCTTSG